MQGTVSKSQFKPKALEYFRSVETSGKELVITDHGRPVLKVVPYKADPKAALPKLRGSVLRYDDLTEPVAAVAPPVLLPAQNALGVRMPRPGSPKFSEIALPHPTPLPFDIVSLLLEDRDSGR